jgi:hypothetical protein
MFIKLQFCREYTAKTPIRSIVFQVRPLRASVDFPKARKIAFAGPPSKQYNPTGN